MKLKALLTALFVAGLAASLAVAAPPPGKGKNKGETSTSTSTATTTTSGPGNGKGKGKGRSAGAGAACRPVVSFVLKGEFVSGSADAEGAGSFLMEVKQANAHGRHLVGDEAKIDVDAKTKFRRRGHAELADLEAGDRLNVHVRSCRRQAESAGAGAPAAAPKLLAKQVIAHPAKAAEEGASESE